MNSSTEESLVQPIRDVRYRPDCVEATGAELHQWIRDSGWDSRSWTDPPGTNHSPHDHPYSHRVFCVSGWIEFTVGDNTYRLTPGDALDLPSGVTHSALSSPDQSTEYWLLRPE